MIDKQTGRKAMLYSVIVLHIWGTLIVWQMTFGDRDSANLANIFGEICFGIFLSLLVLGGDKAAQSFIAARFGGGRTQETTIVTTTTPEPAPLAAERQGESAIEKD